MQPPQAGHPPKTGQNEPKQDKPMTQLMFKSKEFVYNHHLSVPFMPLKVHPRKGVGKPSLDGNLVIQGDNLNALKALMPSHAGQIDCIFIDPPYNTGNEGWCYNDNVNAPMIKEWRRSNPVGIEDGLRHDKWCAMMWPRLKLLHELLSENGSFWMTLNDNEIHHARMMLDEIFGEGNFIATAIWQKRQSPDNDETYLTPVHDYVVCYAKSRRDLTFNRLSRTEESYERYENPDNDPRGSWTSSDLTRREYREHDFYPIRLPSGREVTPASGRSWSVPKESFNKLVKDNRVWFGHDGNAMPRRKRFLSEVATGIVPTSVWEIGFFGGTQEAKKQIGQIFSDEKDIFQTPKPMRLVQRILQLASTEKSIVLDSFAGSGTTAHAVLEANKLDGGNRRFILVEMEDYADNITAERVRRVIKGYTYKGMQRTELLRENVTWTRLKKAEKLVDSVEAIENLHGHEYDKITKTVRDGELVVTGEKIVKGLTEGLGGTFTYCTLGPPLELDKILNGEKMPTWSDFGEMLFQAATNRTIDHKKTREKDFYLGEAKGQHVWLIYKPDLDWLKSPEAALTLDRARAFAAKAPKKKHLVFASARYVSSRTLAEKDVPVEFAPLPYEIYRINRS